MGKCHIACCLSVLQSIVICDWILISYVDN